MPGLSVLTTVAVLIAAPMVTSASLALTSISKAVEHTERWLDKTGALAETTPVIGSCDLARVASVSQASGLLASKTTTRPVDAYFEPNSGPK